MSWLMVSNPVTHLLRLGSLTGALLCFFVRPALAELQLAGAKVHFASASEGSQTLKTRDDFVQRLSPFDRSARMKVARVVSEDEYLAFVGSNVIGWSQAQIELVSKVIDALQPQLGDLSLPLPATIQLIQTTGNEEGGAAYTRGAAIILTKDELAKDAETLQRFIAHELFHVLSRQNPELREKLYRIIGFEKCNEIELPPELKRRKITNPDAPRNDHFIRLRIDGRDCLAVPILLSSAETYDTKRGGEFFAYLQFQFLVIERSAGSQSYRPVLEGASPKLVGPERVSGFMEQIGRNTEYVIHPEEVLAENFALLVLKKTNVASPEILQKMKEVLPHK
jgi:hypothetical protein